MREEEQNAGRTKLKPPAATCRTLKRVSRRIQGSNRDVQASAGQEANATNTNPAGLKRLRGRVTGVSETDSAATMRVQEFHSSV
jgi:hypothetical protein